MYENRNPPELPPCETCRVDPVEDNKEALKIFFMVRDQYIMTEGGPVAINHLAIHEAMRLLKIKDKLKCFNKVCKLANWWIDLVREESK
jgi:hypothetical protein